MTQKVSIVTLTWNGLRYTQHCLGSLFAQTSYPDFDVIVVDNGSTDGTVEWLRCQNDIVLIENNTNLGFAAASNIGISHADPESDVITLNNDIVITQPDWIERLRETAYLRDNVGIVGCRLVDENGRLNHAGSYMAPILLQGEQIAGKELDVGQYTTRREVECTIAAVMYIKREVIRQIGAFCPDYFSYYEDTDYCFMAKRAGYHTWYAGDVNLTHHHNASTRINNIDLRDMYFSSKKVFTQRWKPWLDEQYGPPVELWSSFASSWGQGAKARELARALQANMAAISYSDIHEMPAGTHDPMIEDIKRRRAPDACDRIVFAPAPYFAKALQQHGPKYGFTAYGTTQPPPEWVAAANRMDALWIPSTHEAEAFENAGVQVPTEVVPLGINAEYFHGAVPRRRWSDDFVFLSVFEWTPRKNPETLLHAFSKAFAHTDDVVLICCVHNSEATLDMRAQVAALDLRPGGGRIVVSVNPDIPSHEMPALYASADAYVLPSRAERWPSTIVEAMAVGLPVIATDWGATRDVLDASVGYLLPVDHLEPCPAGAGEWAETNVDDLVDLLVHVAQEPREATNRGQTAAKRVAGLTWDNTATRILELIGTRS